MVWVFRPTPDARAFIQLQTSAFGLPVRNFESPTPPYPFNPVHIHHPTRTMQHRRDAAITVTAILESKCNDVGGQCRFILGQSLSQSFIDIPSAIEFISLYLTAFHFCVAPVHADVL